MRAIALTRRTMPVVPIVVMLLLLFGGCGPTENSSPPAASLSGNTTPTRVPERVTVWSDPPLLPALQQIGTQFTAATGIEVIVTAIARSELMAQFAELAPQGRGPDLVIADSLDVGRLVAAGLVSPADYRSRESGFTRWSRDAFRLAGTLYGLPISGDGLALLRNKSLAKKLPGSIQEMARTGQKLVRAGKAVVPIALPIGTGGDAKRWYPFYSAAGGYLYGQQTDGSFDPDDLGVGLAGSVQAGRLLVEMAADGDINPKLSAEKCAALFAAGRTPYLIGGLAEAIEAVDAGVAVAVAPIPGFDDIPEASPAGPVAYRGFLVSAFARNRPAAERFLIEGVANTTAMTSLLRAQTGLPAWIESLQRAALDPLLAGFADSAEASGPAPNLANVANAWAELSSAQAAILAGGNPKSEMLRARAKIANAAALQ